MNTLEIKKAQVQNTAKVIDYISGSVVSKSIVSKATGSISMVAIDNCKEIKRKITPFDVFILVMDGTAEIVIEDNSTILKTGQSIIIPAHSQNSISSPCRFKMLEVVIKSGYEQEI